MLIHCSCLSTTFSVDFLLPVCIGEDWVGVVYRDKEATLCLMDAHDITNKALLCDPSFDVEAMKWFKCKYDRIWIQHDQRHKIKLDGTTFVAQTRAHSGTMMRNDGVNLAPFVQTTTTQPHYQWDIASTAWVLRYSNAYFEQNRPRKTSLVPLSGDHKFSFFSLQ